MKKIFLLFAAVCVLFACKPTHEDISNGGHITVDELKALSIVTTDIAPNGLNGNVIMCSTSAPVNAKWTIDGKDLIGNYAKKKMRLGDYVVTLTGICADGTELKVDYPVSCQYITDELIRVYVYGGPDHPEQEEFVIEGGDASWGRFSDNEGKRLPYLADAVYYDHQTLVFEITEAKEGPFIWGEGTGLTMRIMTGHWSPTFADDVVPTEGLWELPLTQEMAEWCAKGNKAVDGDPRNRDLDLLMTRGSIKIKSVYYEY